jgi:hypothetical protein
MKNLAVLALFVGSLASLGLTLQAKADSQPVRSALDASTGMHKGGDSGHHSPPNRGRPGEDDSDEEGEEDVAPPAVEHRL